MRMYNLTLLCFGIILTMMTMIDWRTNINSHSPEEKQPFFHYLDTKLISHKAHTNRYWGPNRDAQHHITLATSISCLFNTAMKTILPSFPVILPHHTVLGRFEI